MERDDELQRLRRLYPRVSDAELLKIRDTLERYLELSLRMYERIVKDPAAYERFKQLLEERKKEKRDQA